MKWRKIYMDFYTFYKLKLCVISLDNYFILQRLNELVRSRESLGMVSTTGYDLALFRSWPVWDLNTLYIHKPKISPLWLFNHYCNLCLPSFCPLYIFIPLYIYIYILYTWIYTHITAFTSIWKCVYSLSSHGNYFRRRAYVVRPTQFYIHICI